MKGIEMICSIDDCQGEVIARGWCTAHYRRWRRHGDPTAGGIQRLHKHVPGDACHVDGCSNETHKRGWCNAHYLRWRRHGDPTASAPRLYNPGDTCRVDECSNGTYKKGWCGAHYGAWKKYGTPLGGMRRAEFYQRGRSEGVCEVDGCTSPWMVKWFCSRHYSQIRTKGAVQAAPVNCTICGEPFPDGERVRVDRLYCSQKCANTAWNPKRQGKDRRAEWYIRLYGITIAEYDALLDEQDKRCAICGSTDPRAGSDKNQRMVVDHCHDSGLVRGLLCLPCNSGIGLFHDADTLDRAIDYLAQPRPDISDAIPYRIPRQPRPKKSDPRVCLHCGADISGSHHRTFYCSIEHRKEAERARYLDAGAPRAWRLWHKYKINTWHYDAMVLDQGNRCGICGGGDPRSNRIAQATWYVDHCHDSGAVRGLLCGLCNQGLGQMGDDPAVLRSAAAYLRRPGGN